MDQLVRHQLSVEKTRTIKPSLEDLFLTATGNEGDIFMIQWTAFLEKTNG